ncbi:elongation factor P [candidate division WOR-3 bacterium]|nr:elongation factor P [candidate division WOR-3 bacterium]
MANTSNIKKGFSFELDRKMYMVIEFLHVKPGKGGAFVRTKVKNIETGQVIDMTFKSGENFKEIRLEKNPYEYLYRDGSDFVFMNNNSYEQVNLSLEQMNGKEQFIIENTSVDVLSVGEKIIDIDLPIFVILEIKETEPGIRGNTVSGGNKPAVCNTGLKVTVPLFLNTGDKIKIDTRSGEYVERA